MAGRPRLGVFKLASCDGCQLQLLSCEDELLAIAGALEIAFFGEATSRKDDGGRYHVSLVEGSVSTAEQLEQLHDIRRRSDRLVAIGACATAGGIQALRNWRDVDDMIRIVYATPSYIDTLATSTPIADHVPVDFELRGCPIEKGQLVELITALLVGRKPAIRDEAVCMECKRSGATCVMVAHGTPCLGPVTHAGCGALCPRFRRGCYGCFGPREQAATRSLSERFLADGVPADALVRKLRGFTAWAPAFRDESTRHDHGHDD
ncbi:MAG: oxidoreductase [Myxococcales bacterium]|nr:oxidoreductase [Myxococcales bacterium]